MIKKIATDEIDRKLIYYYRNNYKAKAMAEKLNMELRLVRNRLIRLKKYGYLKRWWEE